MHNRFPSIPVDLQLDARARRDGKRGKELQAHIGRHTDGRRQKRSWRQLEPMGKGLMRPFMTSCRALVTMPCFIRSIQNCTWTAARVRLDAGSQHRRLTAGHRIVIGSSWSLRTLTCSKLMHEQVMHEQLGRAKKDATGTFNGALAFKWNSGNACAIRNPMMDGTPVP